VKKLLITFGEFRYLAIPKLVRVSQHEITMYRSRVFRGDVLSPPGELSCSYSG
jgi:hypothetical protein